MRAMKKRKSPTKLWVKRFRLLPVAAFMLIAVGGLGVLLRMFVKQVEPRVDHSNVWRISEKADDLSHALVARAKKPLPMHDLSLFDPVASGTPSVLSNATNMAIMMGMKSVPVPPAPALEGIIYSETKRSLVSVDGQTVAEGDIVDGWRILLIEPERIRVIHDATKTEKVVVLYEGKEEI